CARDDSGVIMDYW
nr:immunoglobulin heavy chain junction region [Macaca mulatta]